MPARTYNASAEMRSPLAICCSISADGLRSPRSTWLRYGLLTPAARQLPHRDLGGLALGADVGPDVLHRVPHGLTDALDGLRDALGGLDGLTVSGLALGGHPSHLHLDPFFTDGTDRTRHR